MKRPKLEAWERQRRIDFVISDLGGIHPPFEAFYIHSILYTATAADDAFERYSWAAVCQYEPDAIVSAIQEALTHAAALSRFFWPSKGNGVAGARAQKLRQAFQMEQSPLKNRDIRNAFEHFDERLDEFLLADPVGMFFLGSLVDDHTLADEKPGQIFRLVDPYAFVFVLLGKKYDFLPIREEVSRVLELAKEFDKDGSRLPRVGS